MTPTQLEHLRQHLLPDEFAWFNEVCAVSDESQWDVIVFNRLAALRADLARVAGERDAMRDAMAKVRAHTGRMPMASTELLNGLLDSIERIADAGAAFGTKPLFGRVEGMFWWEQQVRGRSSEGVVVKDYAPRPPGAEAVKIDPAARHMDGAGALLHEEENRESTSTPADAGEDAR